MIYLMMAYIIFQVLFDHWGTNYVNSKIIYFAFQYSWVASIAIAQALKGKYYMFYYIFALIMIIISLNEFLAWNTDAQTYAMMVSPPAISVFSIVILVLFILMPSKNALWNGSKTTLSKRS